ncbi:hypothetical protein [Thalassoglobus neptunius]|uniref:hypothetical protein n=1 Tax=Thalassoglobus neptunius TaxID=1938619 RepID=UPI0011B75989|nr:hypothetical protein [Thalassoglobus neptunius]
MSGWYFHLRSSGASLNYVDLAIALIWCVGILQDSGQSGILILCHAGESEYVAELKTTSTD